MTATQVFVLALLSGFGLSSWGQEAESDPDDVYGPAVLEEIIVTAQKIGEQSSLDTPLSITVIGEDVIDKRFLVGMDDYLRFQPGTNFIDRGASRNSVIIRGITADPGRGGAITGMYFDETPVTGLGFAGTGSPDLKLVDIERIEVLHGPQGTLYGAGSMSGTVRTLARAPDTGAFDASVHLGVSATSGNGDTNTQAQAMLNLPLVDESFALRAAAYRFDNSGYMRNVGSSDPIKVAGVEAYGARLSERIEDRGSDTYEGYRVSALWGVSDRLDIRLTAMGQEIDQDGFPTTDIRQAPFEQSRFARQSGIDESLYDDLQLYSLTIDYRQDSWTLISATSWIEYEWALDWDIGLLFRPLYDGLEPPWWLFQKERSEVLTQELRWVWDTGGKWRILMGLFYQDSDSGFDQVANFEGDEERDPWDGTFRRLDRADGNQNELSFFSDLTYTISEQWDVTFGGRHYDFDTKSFSNFTGEITDIASNESGETWKAGVNWRPDTFMPGDEPLLFAIWSQGFRPGSPAVTPPPVCDLDGDGNIDGIGLPLADIESDDLESIELGYKSRFARGKVDFQAAIFDIDWEDIQITVGTPCGFTFPFNAGAAKSKGLEVALSALLSEQLQFDLTASWVNAELTEDTPGFGPAAGSAGDRLPGSPEYNLTLGLEYNFKLGSRPSWVRSDISFVGDYYSTFQKLPPRQGDYTMVDLTAGINLNRWLVDIYVKNLGDADELTWANPYWGPLQPRNSVLRPRTIGLRLGYSYGEN